MCIVMWQVSRMYLPLRLYKGHQVGIPKDRYESLCTWWPLYSRKGKYILLKSDGNLWYCWGSTNRPTEYGRYYSITQCTVLLLRPGWLVQYSGSGSGDEGGHTPRAALSRGWHFKEDKKFSACVQSVKCFTALDIRPPEVFCTVYGVRNSSSPVNGGDNNNNNNTTICKAPYHVHKVTTRAPYSIRYTKITLYNKIGWISESWVGFWM